MPRWSKLPRDVREEMAHWEFYSKQIDIVFLLASQIIRKCCCERANSQKNKEPSLLQMDTETSIGFWTLNLTFQWGEQKRKMGNRVEEQICSLLYLIPRNTWSSDVPCANKHRWLHNPVFPVLESTSEDAAPAKCIIPCYTPASREMPCKAITANLLKKKKTFLLNYPQFLYSPCD